MSRLYVLVIGINSYGSTRLSPVAFSTNSSRRFPKQASSPQRLANQNRPMFECCGASSPKSYPTSRRAGTESPDRNASVRHVETNVTFFMLADEPHRGQMKASPTEKERSRQRRTATGWTTGVLCCLNAIIILSIQSIFGNKTCKLYISWLTKPTATPCTTNNRSTAGTSLFASNACQGGFPRLNFSSILYKKCPSF